ncbi:SDR family NAD(P)-dependent oxidoreductase [Plectonema cf. radiosum LEGE 06105]|uniref:SDR family NAD(P)-dependent oxidoreductase n=1 Tax=Plectonema cf. radiosum LEGE 06105 TaxID=945769 RepID=A0A8J7F4X0_9CYAN|nr:SDR family NAD(P)-dependent oxidoreductase [Plectonema radiosum]MBE9215267.1 SDR family NAD(P)-dependent oxidoreductase [Plectonema cf. radiosum LEGE 06105]
MRTATSIRPESLFIVSGGAKGITAKCVIELAQQYPCKFILLGRSSLLKSEPLFAKNCFDEATLKKRIMEYLLEKGEKPTPIEVKKIYNQIISDREIKRTLEKIKQAGGEAQYINADVTNTQDLQQKITAVTESMGTITGIIHGAGNLADKLLEKKTEEDFEKVYSAKIQGLENLLACVNLDQLEHLVLYSSVAGFYGNIGQSDYALSNEILNKSAHLFKQHYPQCHVVAINWGGWDSGMVTPELKKEFARRGIEIIPVEAGAKMLVNELHDCYRDSTQVVIGSPISPPPAPLNSQLRTYRIHRKFTEAANPFLQDHIVGGKPVLPATCGTAWMINACEQLYPGYKFFYYNNFKVLKGIIFNGKQADEYILDLEEIAKNEQQEIIFKAKIWSRNGNGKLNYHYSIDEIHLLSHNTPSPNYEQLNMTEDKIIPITGNDFYQENSSIFPLFHGESFKGITKVVNISPEKITIECIWNEIDRKQQGQFPVQWVNPYSIDLSTHPLWVWLQHYHQEVCLPAEIKKHEQFAATPYNKPFYVSCEVRNKSNSSVSADFIIHDNQGKIYSRLLGGKGIIIPTQSLKS